MHSKRILYIPSAEELKRIQEEQEQLRRQMESMTQLVAVCPYCMATLSKYGEPHIHCNTSAIIRAKCPRCHRLVSYQVNLCTRKPA